MLENKKKITNILVIYMIISIMFLIIIRMFQSNFLETPFILGTKETMSIALRKITTTYNSYQSNKKNKTPIILYRPNKNELEIYSLLPDKKILLTKFIKKFWGVWNIDGWYLARDNMVQMMRI